ncbi:excinuclease ABC subunit UvrA [Corynebacterium urealyticum]|uniref:UvrABC system protein A n=1 Tax=Corynebacterium urealyticum TaxID=43771 RepID=A0A5D4G1U1_9CORY|nr:excinuclease ABC subunit UvrA [Corynebacterium urealyticum]TYR20540.1 excinuclease ABC subunit UvrA [Corynebacterium urealyticum]
MAQASSGSPAPHTTERAGHDPMIRVRDAHLHNLKHIDVDLPRDTLVAVTGVSGSGKSSLAFGTIHGEAQRRYLESVSPFARRLIGGAVNPRVGSVTGLPPTVALQQSTTLGGARSSVGTISNMSNSIRLLFSRSGSYPDGMRERLEYGRLDSDAFSPNTTAGMCPECQGTGTVHRPTEESMVPDPSLSIWDGAIAAWPGAWLGKNFRDILGSLGYPLDVPWRDIPQEDRDWILFTDEQPVVTVHPVRDENAVYGSYKGKWRSVATYLNDTLAETESDKNRRRVLSFMHSSTCPTCQGRGFQPDTLQVTYAGYAIDEFNGLALKDVLAVLEDRLQQLAGIAKQQWTEHDEAEELLLDQVLPTVRAAIELGLGHLSLSRPARSLSAGEHQRLRLASQLNSSLFGTTYVLDEPSAGLHVVERKAVSELLQRFITAGNSVLLVEHDMSLVAGCDWVVDIGPRAGERGGQLVFSGPTDEFRARADQLGSPTATALNEDFPELTATPAGTGEAIGLRGVHARAFDGADVDFPLGALTAVTGVSGSGKSTLVIGVLADVASRSAKQVVGADEVSDEDPDAEVTASTDAHGDFRVDSATGVDKIRRLVHITQKPIGRTVRSTVATYTGLFDHVRRLFAATPEAKRRGMSVSDFSYNTKKGRCPECDGAGSIEVELVFLPGTYTTCPACHGKRYKPEILEVQWNGRSIADILALTVDEALEVFAEEPRILRSIKFLHALGLGYLRLGQGSPELSGGEAQRIKLASEMQRGSSHKHSLYLLDEPTTGLHPADVDLLLAQLRRLVDDGATVVVVEHDLRVVAQADHVIDVGPGAGDEGGQILATGTPAAVAQQGMQPDSRSVTAQVLADRAGLR